MIKKFQNNGYQINYFKDFLKAKWQTSLTWTGPAVPITSTSECSAIIFWFVPLSMLDNGCRNLKIVCIKNYRMQSIEWRECKSFSRKTQADKFCIIFVIFDRVIIKWTPNWLFIGYNFLVQLKRLPSLVLLEFEIRIWRPNSWDFRFLLSGSGCILCWYSFATLFCIFVSFL